MFKGLMALMAMASLSFAGITSINDIPLGSNSSLLKKSTVSEESDVDGQHVRCMYREGENTAVNDTKYNAILYCYSDDKLFAIRYVAFSKIDDSSAKDMITKRFGTTLTKLSTGSEVIADVTNSKKVEKMIEFSVKKNKKGEEYSSFNIIDRSLLK